MKDTLLEKLLDFILEYEGIPFKYGLSASENSFRLEVYFPKDISEIPQQIVDLH